MRRTLAGHRPRRRNTPTAIIDKLTAGQFGSSRSEFAGRLRQSRGVPFSTSNHRRLSKSATFQELTEVQLEQRGIRRVAREYEFGGDVTGSATWFRQRRVGELFRQPLTDHTADEIWRCPGWSDDQAYWPGRIVLAPLTPGDRTGSTAAPAARHNSLRRGFPWIRPSFVALPQCLSGPAIISRRFLCKMTAWENVSPPNKA